MGGSRRTSARHRSIAVLTGLGLVGALAAASAAPVAATHGGGWHVVERASVASDGTEANGHSGGPAISTDGRFVAFISLADNLVAGDTNGRADAFVYDRATGTIELVSRASDMSQGGAGGQVAISADGNVVAFGSRLATAEQFGMGAVFVFDRVAGVTELVSVASDGTSANHVSLSPSLSFDGRYVAFASLASNLAVGQREYTWDVFVRDRQSGVTEWVSAPIDGIETFTFSQGPAISDDGRYVAFNSDAPNLVPGDTNTKNDVIIHDRTTGENELVSVATDGTQGNDHSAFTSPAVSADARYVAFGSRASNLVPGDANIMSDIFVRDRMSGTTTRVSIANDGSEGNERSRGPSISASGRFVAFKSAASNLMPGPHNWTYNVYVHDQVTGTIDKVNISLDGALADAYSGEPDVADIGSASPTVVFNSDATNLVPGDTNASSDVFAAAAVTTAADTTPPIVTSATVQEAQRSDPLLHRRLAVVATDEGGSGLAGIEYGWTPGLAGTSPARIQFLEWGSELTVSFADAQPSEDWTLWVRAVDGAGNRSGFVPAFQGETPNKPLLVALGDSITSGHDLVEVSGGFVLDCNNPLESYAFDVFQNLREALPDNWQPVYRNEAKSGFGVQEVIGGGTDACDEYHDSPLAATLAALEAHDGSWNRVVITAGVNDTNWTHVLSVIAKADWVQSERVGGPTDSRGFTSSCERAIANTWSFYKVADVPATIEASVNIAVTSLRQSHPSVPITWLGYYNFAGTGPVPVECEEPLDEALDDLHAAIRAGFGDDPPQWRLIDDKLRMNEDLIQGFWYRIRIGEQGWPHPNSAGHAAISTLIDVVEGS